MTIVGTGLFKFFTIRAMSPSELVSPALSARFLFFFSPSSSIASLLSFISCFCNLRKRLCVSIVVKSLYSQIAMTLGCHLRFRTLRIWECFPYSSYMTPDVGKSFLHLTYVLLSFIFKSSYSWINVPNLHIFISVVLSWIIWRMSHISLSISQLETRKNSSRPRS